MPLEITSNFHLIIFVIINMLTKIYKSIQQCKSLCDYALNLQNALFYKTTSMWEAVKQSSRTKSLPAANTAAFSLQI